MTVEQHVQQTKIMTEELGQRNRVLKTELAEETVLSLCARLIDICDDLAIHGPLDTSYQVISPYGPSLFSIGNADELLSFYRAKNYSAYFDYVHRNIIASIGLLEQVDMINEAAQHCGGGHVGRVALAFVCMLFDDIEERVRTSELEQLETRLNACNFFTVKALIGELQTALTRLPD